MKEEKNEKDLYSDKDIYLAATLLTIGFPIERVDYQIEGERQQAVGYFSFEESEKLRDAIKDYWSEKLEVEPRKFISNMRGLKSQVSGVYKSPHSKFNK